MRDGLLGAAERVMAALRVVSGLLLVGSVGINFANIIGRYFFAVSIPWAEEMMLFLMVGCVFSGIGLVGWSGRHIRMDVIVLALPKRARRVVEIVSELVLIATSIALAVMAWPVVTMLAQLDERSDTANIPLVIPQSVLPLGFLIMAVLVAIRLLVRGPANRGGPGESSL